MMQIFSKRKQSPESPSDYERECLKRRIGDIDAWLAEVDGELGKKGLGPKQIASMSAHEQALKDTEQAQLLRRERGFLLAERERAARKLRGPSSDDRQREQEKERSNSQYLDLREAESRAVIERHIQKFTARGEHQQAIIWRQELVGLRERIARDELGIGR